MLNRTVKYFADICNTDGPSNYRYATVLDELEIDRLLNQEQYLPVLKRRVPRDVRKAIKEMGVKK